MSIMPKLALVAICAGVSGVFLPGGAIRGATPFQPQAAPPASESINQQADAAYQHGMRLLGEKRYGEALEQFQSLERIAPRLPQGPSGQGIALALMGKPGEAIEALQKALEIDPSYWVARRELGIVYWSQGRKEEAHQELRQVAPLFPDDNAVDVILGQYEFEHGNFQQALDYFGKAPSPVAQDVRLSLMKGQSLLETGQKAEASQVLQALADRPDLTPEQKFQTAWALGKAELYATAIKLFDSLPPDYPDHFRRNYGLALAYFENRQYPDCVRVLKPLAAGSGHPEVFSLLGVAEEKTGDTQAAYDTFRQGILSNPDDPQNYINIATLSCLHLNYELAVQILSSGIERIPNLHELYLSRGIAYTLAAKFDEAQGDFSRSIGMAPDDAGNYVALGVCQLERARLNEAVQSFQKSVSMGVNEPKPYYFLAEALIQRGVEPGTSAFEQAKAALDKALQLDPTLTYAYMDRAKLALRENRVESAISDLEHAQSLDPHSRTTAYMLAQAYQRHGEKDKADALFARVKSASDEEARQFQKDALTQALVVISQHDHPGP